MKAQIGTSSGRTLSGKPYEFLVVEVEGVPVGLSLGTSAANHYEFSFRAGAPPEDAESTNYKMGAVLREIVRRINEGEK